jgi:hydroxymethylpyrimidine kinase/phosphomethylpyrimidine kinase
MALGRRRQRTDARRPVNVLTIAGTDPSGGAGIQADLQVIRDCGCHGLSVVAAVVWQNTSGVRGWLAIAPEVLQAQLDAVFADIPVHAVKIGMLGTPENVQVVQRALAGKSIPIVLDPVLASGDGAVELAADLLTELRALAAASTLITPNMPEAETLLDGYLPARDLACSLSCRLATAVLLKVGHCPGSSDLVDILATLPPDAKPAGADDMSYLCPWARRDGQHSIDAKTLCTPLCGVGAGQRKVLDLAPLPRIPEDVRGTGCQLSTAIDCRLALGDDLLSAIEWSRAYLSRMLEHRQSIGRGRPVIVRV